MLKNKSYYFKQFGLASLAFILFSLTLIYTNLIPSSLDYKFYDFYNLLRPNKKVEFNNSNRISYLYIDDNTYKNTFRHNTLDRSILSRALLALKKYNPEAIIIDIIFAYPSNGKDDRLLVNATKELGNVYFPVAFSTKNSDSNTIPDYQINEISQFFDEINTTQQNDCPTISRLLLPLEGLITNARGVGHISESPDQDGILRHSQLVLKAGKKYIPALYLKTYLDFIQVPFNKIIVHWGNYLEIPALSSSWINKDIFIPIDKFGRTLIPFKNVWGKDFDSFTLQRFIELDSNGSLMGTLKEYLEGRIIIIGDASTGIADIARTPLNQKSPMLAIQSNMLNALFNNDFYRISNNDEILILSMIIAIILFITRLIKNQLLGFLVAIVSILILLPIFWIFFINGLIFPVSSLLIYSIFTIGLLALFTYIDLNRENKIIGKKNIQIEFEMNEARKIQLSMIPEKLPKIDGWEVEVFMQPASIVGGDFYDFAMDQDGSTNVILGDALGHGLAAGTMVTILKSLFLTNGEIQDLRTYLNTMNEKIKLFNIPKLYICVGILKILNNKVTFSSAGIPPILIIRNHSIIEHILKAPPIGFSKNFPYEVKEIQIFSSDKILLMSDGVIEQRDKLGEMFGRERLLKVMKNNLHLSIGELLNVIKSESLSWSKKKQFDDDVTMIGLVKL